MKRFRFDLPTFDASVARAVSYRSEQDGIPLSVYAAYGIPNKSSLDCDRGTARLYCCWKSVQQNPHDGLRLLELAHCYRLEMGDPRRAAAIYREVERLDRPGLDRGAHDEDPLFYLAWLHADLGFVDMAVSLYARCVERLEPRATSDNEGRAVLHYHLGSVYHESEMWIEAAQEYKAALKALGTPELVTARGEGTDSTLADVSRAQPDRCFDAFERFFGLESVPEVAAELDRAERCLEFTGRRDCCIDRSRWRPWSD